MSGEFGESGGGFFHTKIENACDDAKGGETEGARLMASILEPLSEMARAVSWEEACDTGPPNTMEVFFKQYPKLKTSLRAVEYFIEGAKRIAAEIMASEIEDHVSVGQAGDHYVVVSKRRHRPLTSAESLVRDEALKILVRRKFGKNCYKVSSVWSSSDPEIETHYLSSYGDNESQLLRDELARAKSKLVFYETVGACD